MTMTMINGRAYRAGDFRYEEQVHQFLGLDLGKSQDFSALVGLEYRRTWVSVRNPVTWGMDPENEKVEYSVRQAARIPLGTKYTEVVDKMERLLRRVTAKYDCTLVVDATGVGAAVMEMFEGMMPRVQERAMLVPVVITGSGTEGGKKTRSAWQVSRADLLSGLQVMLDTKQLAIASDLEHALTLKQELLEIRSLQSGGAGKHDDLAMALALACWRARKVQPPPLVAAGQSQKAKGKPFGFQNNAFGAAIYGSGSSPWGWPQQQGPGRRKREEDDDREE